MLPATRATKMRLTKNMFTKATAGYGLWKIGYVSPNRYLVYISYTEDSRLIDATFGSENPTQKALSELRNACKL